uniref:Uncharacterized protein n=1 Tax=Trieres chinensis TaxID=1514140 RepID=A0A7S2EPD4_TRICV|mmetsp:Transcript_33409/g.68209  ORF Transcript_33409/g.68209 Transcript_33409/m.68209 type:complete len:408 (+) Transcript_33409:61-1284(+)
MRGHQQHGSQCPCKSLPQVFSSFTAAEFGHLGTLARQGASVANRVDSGGYTPLHLAAQHDRSAAVALLLRLGADVDGLTPQQRDTNETRNGHTTAAKGGGSGDGGDAPPLGCGATPLHRASFSGAVSSMQVLLGWSDPTSGRRCDLLARDASFGDRMTPLHKAAAGGRHLAVLLLLDALRERGELKEGLAAKDVGGRTSLEVAKDFMRQQDQEGQSVRRWDGIAGHAADWGWCADLLRVAEVEAGIAKGSDESAEALEAQKLPLLNFPPPPQHLSSASVVLCLDCGADSDGNYNTSSWESAFCKVLETSVEKVVLKRETKKRHTDINSQQAEHEDASQSVDRTSITQRDSKPRSSKSACLSALSESSPSIILGNKCGHCNKHCLTLFRGKDSVLLCNKCVKKQKRLK